MPTELTEQLLMDEVEVAAFIEAAKPPKEKRQRTAQHKDGFFIVPVAWREALECCKPELRAVAWGLLERAGGNYRGGAIHWTAWDASQIKIGPRRRRKLLRDLEQQGLIALDHQHGAPFAIRLLQYD